MGKKNKVHSIKYNFIMNMMLTISTYAFSFITFPYVARVLLAEGNGKISFVSSVANYFMLLASLGIPTYGVRACAQVRDDKDKLSKTVHEILLIATISTAFAITVYAITICLVPKFYSEYELFLINGINILLNTVGMNWLYQAIEQYDYITIRSLGFKIISVIFMFAFVRNTNDYVIYGAITVFANVGSNILNLKKSFSIVNYKKYKNYNLRQHMRPIFILFSLSLAGSVYNNLDNIMLGFFKGDEAVGFYNAAVKIKNMLGAVVISLGTVLLPRMTYYINNDNNKKFIETINKAMRFVLLISIPMFIYFLAYSKECVVAFSGNAYIPAVNGMRAIIVCIVFIGISNLIGVQVLTPLKLEKFVLLSTIIGAILDLVFNIIFIPKWGVTGAAFATAIAEAGVLITQMFFAKNYVDYISYKTIALKYTIVSIICILITIPSKIYISNLYIRIVVSIILFGFIYLVGLLLLKDELIDNVVYDIKAKISRE